MNEALLTALTHAQRDLFLGLTSPTKIQACLDAIPYSTDPISRCPLRVLQDRKAHCFDGALFAAAALRQIGHQPLLVDLCSEPGLDDDHVLAIFKANGAYGAVAQSNFVGLRYREAVYRSLRELVMSYFEVFFNINGIKTLRSYSAPCNLAAFDQLEWTVLDEGVNAIEERLNRQRHFPVITAGMVGSLSRVDELSYQAGMLGADAAGLYKP